jgi:hypothetical protein
MPGSRAGIDILYVGPSGATGTEAGKPGFWRDRQFIWFDGYQRFCLAPHTIKVRKRYHQKKYAIIRPYLLCIGTGSSIIDLGCNAGVMGFQAYFDGFREITFVDREPEYLQLVQAGLEHVGAMAPAVLHSKAEDATAVADILFALAIVHRLYACTEAFGSLEGIIDKLSTLCRKAMFVEWIDAQSFDRLSRNPEFDEDNYKREDFIRALRKRYAHVRQIGTARFGREIWLASHVRYRPGLSSLIRQWIDLLSSRRFLHQFHSIRARKIRLAQLLSDNECHLRKGWWLLCGTRVAKHVSVGKLPGKVLRAKPAGRRARSASLRTLMGKVIEFAVPPFAASVRHSTQCGHPSMRTGEFSVFVWSRSGHAEC